MIHLMRIDEEPDVRSIFDLCHPCWPIPPDGFYVAFPTLVAVRGLTVVGFTSFGIGVAPTGHGWVMYGRDLCVHPTYQGKGLGLDLHRSRLQIGAQVGVETFIGLTWETNTPMRRIFAATDAARHGVEPLHFPDNDPPADGLVYIGPVRR